MNYVILRTWVSVQNHCLICTRKIPVVVVGDVPDVLLSCSMDCQILLHLLHSLLPLLHHFRTLLLLLVRASFCQQLYHRSACFPHQTELDVDYSDVSAIESPASN
jgi:hypothetical protein